VTGTEDPTHPILRKPIYTRTSTIISYTPKGDFAHIQYIRELCSQLQSNQSTNHIFSHQINTYTLRAHIRPAPHTYTAIHTPILTGRDPYLQPLEHTRIFTETLHTLPFTNAAGLGHCEQCKALPTRDVPQPPACGKKTCPDMNIWNMVKRGVSFWENSVSAYIQLYRRDRQGTREFLKSISKHKTNFAILPFFVSYNNNTYPISIIHLTIIFTPSVVIILIWKA